jgi:DNA-binding transcriptional LysR family regulator
MIDTECRFASSELEALRHGHRGQLRIGGGPFWGATLLPRAIGRLHARFPDVRINLEIGVNNALHPKLLDGELDLVVSAKPKDISQFPNHIAFASISTIHHRLFARREHPLFDRQGIKPDDLSRFHWVVYQNDPDVIERLTAALRSFGARPPRVAVEATSLMAVLELVRSGDFLACLAAPLIGVLQDIGIRPLSIDQQIWSFPAGILYHRAIEASAPFQVLRHGLEEDAARVGLVPSASSMA